MTKAVSVDVAKIEVEKWLDFKRINSRKREANQESIESLINGFSDGILTLNEKTHEIDFNLTFPIGENINKLTFKPRVNVGRIHDQLKGVKSGDMHQTVLAYISVLSEQNSGVIRQLDTEDYSIASSIVIFFF